MVQVARGRGVLIVRMSAGGQYMCAGESDDLVNHQSENG